MTARGRKKRRKSGSAENVFSGFVLVITAVAAVMIMIKVMDTVTATSSTRTRNVVMMTSVHDTEQKDISDGSSGDRAIIKHDIEDLTDGKAGEDPVEPGDAASQPEVTDRDTAVRKTAAEEAAGESSEEADGAKENTKTRDTEEASENKTAKETEKSQTSATSAADKTSEAPKILEEEESSLPESHISQDEDTPVPEKPAVTTEGPGGSTYKESSSAPGSAPAAGSDDGVAVVAAPGESTDTQTTSGPSGPSEALSPQSAGPSAADGIQSVNIGP